ncbi:MAG: hypothetical protein A3B99_01135 [Candidatus Yanofskybacteria bacterium RIFCSPHIGHO2_02_FULL_44_12b]|nr:MAG: hypothetical protein A2659_03800 [Candidatus Yanofskybacteria bacterium RIFCSPHIGHO2_01_FULL_44_24]OGN15436.1 MAG: hypothetical protein A3B99_01135 [Candidatus Yanofskybacteria bacterium RIFCSPHIGHO2_02_FULL_44_12b]OGN25420.1 MAG: hypothetical protein A2925_00100 [Candidatus Yanofskybacteria bacterium RIFCSPLOWO2_01_FULL_44_22]
MSTYEYIVASPYFAYYQDETEEEKTRFTDAFFDLPVALKNFLSSPKTAQYIYTMTADHEMGDIEASVIASLVRDVIVGKIFVKDFPLLLSSGLNLDQQKASSIANKIASDLFTPILEYIKAIQHQKFGDKIKLAKLESKPKIDTETFIRSQTPPLKKEMPEQPEKEVTVLSMQAPVESKSFQPLPQKAPSPPPPIRQALPQQPPHQPSPPIPATAITPPKPSVTQPPPNLPRPEPVPNLSARADGLKPAQSPQTEQKGNVLDLRSKEQNPKS